MRSLASDVSGAQIQTRTRALIRTLPERAAPTDFSYGVPREALSAASLALDRLSAYCWDCTPLNCYARLDNAACTQPRYFAPISSGLALLDAYGVKGDITVSYINKDTGKMKQQSVVGDGNGVKFCSFLPRPAAYSALDPYVTSYPAWNVAMKRAEVACGGTASRRQGGPNEAAREAVGEAADSETRGIAGGPPHPLQGPRGRRLHPRGRWMRRSAEGPAPAAGAAAAREVLAGRAPPCGPSVLSRTRPANALSALLALHRSAFSSPCHRFGAFHGEGKRSLFSLSLSHSLSLSLTPSLSFSPSLSLLSLSLPLSFSFSLPISHSLTLTLSLSLSLSLQGDGLAMPGGDWEFPSCERERGRERVGIAGANCRRAASNACRPRPAVQGVRLGAADGRGRLSA